MVTAMLVRHVLLWCGCSVCLRVSSTRCVGVLTSTCDVVDIGTDPPPPSTGVEMLDLNK